MQPGWRCLAVAGIGCSPQRLVLSRGKAMLRRLCCRFFMTVALLFAFWSVILPAKPAMAASLEETTELDWPHPRFPERRAERLSMVKTQIISRRPSVKSAAVLEAMRQVPRHLFVPPRLQRLAYADRPLPIGYGQTISQPYIVALMTAALQVKPGMKVLEIGTGSGYQAAVLAELTPSVFSIEIIEELARQAAARLRELGYTTVKVKADDGYYGWPAEAPFDGIIVTCAAGHLPPPLLQQLKPEGRLVIPLGTVFQVQRLVVVHKNAAGKVFTEELLPVVFVPMTGAVQKK